MNSVAIDYIPPIRDEDGRTIGIDVAVRTLLDAYLRYSQTDSFYCRTSEREDYDRFRERMFEMGTDPDRCQFLPAGDSAGLAQISTLFRPDPNINRALATRAEPNAYGICGLSHTMSSMQVMGTLATAIAEPLQPWDAIVCPSNAIRSVVEALWESAGQGAPPPPAQLPVIPLGIDTEHFASLVDAEKRAAQRNLLGVSEDDAVVLAYGRLSYHNKSHPLPLLLAAEALTKKRKGNGNIHLVFFGYFTGDSFRKDYARAAESICETAHVTFIENQDARFPDALWAGADIFVSLVDNVQESFGLTPIEAMASGLPVLVTDWDGYRDTVRDGVDGFLVPTLAPPAGSGQELVRRYLAGEDVYGEYLAGTSQSVAVDVEATAAHLERLVETPALRRKMGTAAQARVRAIYDWKSIIPAYEDLWRELNVVREREARVGPRVKHAITGPTELDPYAVFRSFPTHALRELDRIEVSDQAARLLAQRLQHRMNMFAPVHLIEPAELPRLLTILNRNRTVGEALVEWPDAKRNHVLRTLVWLVKMGVARYLPAL
ncbi:MAG: glycosyltransferase family 4 protein [Pseudomonadota bacterium]|nr:glycosyltransferase family 4 protein [Pseudomonadota bacterium]